MSLESVINNILQSLQPKCAVSNFASIAKILSQPRVASALSGKEPFKNEDALAHLAVARKMKELSDLAAPLPLDWSQVDAIRNILGGVSDKTLHISVCQEQPVAPPEQQFYVFMPNEGFYFARRTLDFNKKTKITGSYQPMAAPRMTRECADKIVEALQRSGHQAQLVTARATIDCPQDDFEILWGQE